MNEIYIVKVDGTKEIFNPIKLRTSLIRSGASNQLAEDVVQKIAAELRDGMNTHDIYRRAFEILRSLQRPLATNYSLRRSLMALGPSGFPFEKFIGEIFKKKGYSVLIDQVVKGKCVEHEIDIIAYKPDHLVMIEAKFHNQYGMKSDLKVALYVKARYDDLKGIKFSFGGVERELDEGWLITNTKFTESAVKYAMCQNIPMIGWNYPERASLLKMIDDSGLHPITSLTSLTDHHKQELMTKGTVLCNTLRQDPEVLKSIGITGESASEVLEESRYLCPSV
ncbi:MAG: restriction endonuclease [Patescibacteria group bacterium]